MTREPHEVAQTPRTVSIGSDHSDLYQGNGSSRVLASRLAESGQRVVVISDHQVESLVRPTIFTNEPWLSVPPGEDSKCLESVAGLWSALCEHKADRATAVVAVGGGMVGDLAGFVASTYLRGLPFYSVPTSLLAMVDASVGGKVGIDLPEGKNLVGRFYPAGAVAVDPELLQTLPEAEWASGMAEVIKHAILDGEALWNLLERFQWGDRADLKVCERLLRQAVEVKLRVVTEDPYERSGLRATLNLGHTFGHALEWCSGYKLRHGEAVALGLLAAVRLSRMMGLLETDFEPKLVTMLSRFRLPTVLPNPEDPCWNWADISEALGRDKKNSEGQWTFILPVCVGRVETVVAPSQALVEEAFTSLKRSVEVGS